MKTLYLECLSGISGDMTVAALLDLGADETVLRRGLDSLGVDGYRLEISRVDKSGIDACDFHVILDHPESTPPEQENGCCHRHHQHPHQGEGHHHGHNCHGGEGHHHDHEHPHPGEGHHHGHEHPYPGEGHHHGHEHPHPGEGHHHGHNCHGGEGHHHDHKHPHQGEGHHHDHEHPHQGEEHHHDHEHPHQHGHCQRHQTHGEHAHGGHSHSHGGEHHHRNLGDIVSIIQGSGISPNAKKLAEDIFAVVAQAEAKVHGKSIDEVHFHEVGAVDSIVDIVAVAICVDNLGVEQVIASPLYEGTGKVWCQHGWMPVPAPATLEIVKNCNIPLVVTDNQGEMVTPTGAAIVGALAQGFHQPEGAAVTAIGYGAGKRQYKTANVVRAMLLEQQHTASTGNVVKLECNLDDMTGEQLGYACELLLESGALDVWCTPIVMKKSRPANMLSVLCHPSEEQRFTQLILANTSTIGVRRSLHQRTVMERTLHQVATPYGDVTVKDCRWNGLSKRSVEFESAKALAVEKDVPIDAVYRAALSD